MSTYICNSRLCTGDKNGRITDSPNHFNHASPLISCTIQLFPRPRTPPRPHGHPTAIARLPRPRTSLYQHHLPPGTSFLIPRPTERQSPPSHSPQARPRPRDQLPLAQPLPGPSPTTSRPRLFWSCVEQHSCSRSHRSAVRANSPCASFTSFQRRAAPFRATPAQMCR